MNTHGVEAGSGERVKAVSLLSGGLDSILATRVVPDQGVDVLALHFITPFFGDDKRGREAEVEAAYRERYGIRLRVVDVSDAYLEVLANPRYGYGKNFNPCVDCKIFLIRTAAEIMRQEGARFLITGEVVGQRPMSQRRDAMNAIAKHTGVRELILRPLCARLLPPTAVERNGWVDRSRLYDFSGRNRKPQMELAQRLGITEYPTPAGGCRLTDPTLAGRVEKYFALVPGGRRRADDLRMLLAGRPYRFPGGSLLTMGRNQGENEAVARLFREGDWFVQVPGVPGPLAVFRPAPAADERALAAAAVLRHCPKAPAGACVGFSRAPEAEGELVTAATAADLDAWRC